ncbi:MAG: UDP-glucose 4-epimerase GalE [Planctomycetaceae bacterium]|nr:UDP-glucose 4-epimerase GalE [Planctomycetaceae bacterium]
MNILVTGGAGYIGSHAVRQLCEAGHEVVVLDSLVTGHREAVPDEVPFYQYDLAQTGPITELLVKHQVDGVMHFAALALVGESVRQPLMYYANNTAGAVSLLTAMKNAGVKKFVFSSTAATYGEPNETPIYETTAQTPINPYGRSKWFTEQMLYDEAHADPMFALTIFRYFNVAGATTDGTIGEAHDVETHLIPNILFAAMGKKDKISVFGTDYQTPDGTCIRDYVHVDDLVNAHLSAMTALTPGDVRVYNLGSGNGYSVREILDAAKIVIQHEIPTEYVDRRKGDPTVLLANSDKAKRELGWNPKYTDMKEIIETAWRWHISHPNGFAK